MYVTDLDSTRPETAGAPRHTRAGDHPARTASTESLCPDRRATPVTRDLDHTPQSVSRARHLTQQFLGNSRNDAAEAVVLVVSELVTNAIEHAQPPVMLHLHRETTGNRVWVGVTDGGPAPDEASWTSPRTDAEHGRGLSIVDTLADAHGTHHLTNGTATTHWARLHTT
ncbi:ATP-binding protein [Streptomyces sp. NBC_01017]|uniref:ATP-binding protein n=1 Tax=Streptomyces sp. NBC_00180 TaxID=2903632 RepID=A0AAU1ID22_9ACTN|nr:ATP-binding protein [Streptomyces sp. NBC_01017]WSV35948.1 ATP-binding protein [Streptomyces sp. NBC_01017]